MPLVGVLTPTTHSNGTGSTSKCNANVCEINECEEHVSINTLASRLKIKIVPCITLGFVFTYWVMSANTLFSIIGLICSLCSGQSRTKCCVVPYLKQPQLKTLHG